MGRVVWSSEVSNCSPRHGQYGGSGKTEPLSRKDEWLKPLLDGDIRCVFAMTEPDVASSDATNIRSSITLEITTITF